MADARTLVPAEAYCIQPQANGNKPVTNRLVATAARTPFRHTMTGRRHPVLFEPVDARTLHAGGIVEKVLWAGSSRVLLRGRESYDGQGMVKRRGFTWIIWGCARVQTAIINVHLGPGVGFRLAMPTRDIGSDDYTARVDRFKLGADVIPSDIDIEDQLRLFDQSGDSTVAASGEQTPGSGPIVLEVTAGKLGHGSFGTVTHVWDVSTGNEFAAKAPLNTQDYDRAA